MIVSENFPRAKSEEGGVTFKNEVQYLSRTLGEPPLSFLQTRATRENTTWRENEASECCCHRGDRSLCSGVRYLAQRGVLHRHLAQEEVHVVPVVDGVQEVRLWNIKTLLITSSFI